MTCHYPQHLLFGIIALPFVTSEPLYQRYNLIPRTASAHTNPSSIQHRLLQIQDFSIDLDTANTKCISPLIEWSMSHIKKMGYSTYKDLYESKILEMPYVYKHYIDKNEEDESFGYDGSQTEELVKRHRDTMAFWTEADVDDSITTNGILLLSMHGRDLLDNEKLVPTIIHMFDFENENDILEFAKKVKEFIEALPSGYDNPLLTMNAVATRGGAGSRSGQTIASLIIGDGVIQFVNDHNLSLSGPDFVHAHEFRHHLQYEMDMIHNVPPGYENDIRRKELMADAISAYFLAHDRGGNMDVHEIGEFIMTAFATGDCNVGQSDHHGTPKQRYCASVWGASQAALANGSVLIDPETFVELFNRDYHGIFELDDLTCTLILEDVDENVNSVASNQAETNNDHASFPVSVEVAFLPGEDYETTDRSETGYSELLNQEDIQMEPPHETVYKYGLPDQAIEYNLPSSSTSPAEQNRIKKGDEAIILVAEHPSESQFPEINNGNKKYACNLPWVYCADQPNSSSRNTNNSLIASVLVVFTIIALL